MKKSPPNKSPDAPALQVEDREGFYRDLIRNASDAIFSSDLEGNLIFANPAAAKLTGYSVREVQGMNAEVLTAVEYQSLMERMQSQKMREGGTTVYEIELIRKNGTRVPVEIRTWISARRGKPPTIHGIVRDITEYRHAQKELEYSLSTLNATLESTADGLLVVDLEGLVVRSNQQFSQMWRIPPALMKTQEDRQMLRFVLDQLMDAKQFLIKVKELYRNPTAESFDIIHFKDGRIFERYSKPHQVGSLIVGRVWSFRDVTVQRTAERELEKSLSLLQATLEATADGIVAVGRGFEILSFNARFCEIWRLPRALVAAGNMDEVIQVVLDQLKDPTGFVAKIRQLRLHPERECFDVLEFKDGRIIERYSSPQRVGKEVVGRVLSFRDVTEKRQTEQSLQQGALADIKFEQELKELIALVNQISQVPTVDALMQQAVHRGCRALGFDRMGIWFFDPAHTALMGSYFTDENGNTFDARKLRIPLTECSSETRRLLAEKIPFLLREDGPLDGYRLKPIGRGMKAFAAMRDGETLVGLLTLDNLLQKRPITPRQLELLGIYATVLGHLYTLKRSQEALLKQTQELTRSNADLEKFAYVSSHDLQEPLRMVASFVQLLGERYRGKLDADADEFIRYAVEGAERMQLLIESLLEYSRVGRTAEPPQAVESGVALKEALTNLKIAIREKNAHVTHGKMPLVMANAMRLTQLFQNLISNALKFRGEKSPQVRITAARDQDLWVFSVSDNGIGLDPQYADRIFEIFQRLHTREQYAGTGIGLAICKKIVEHYGGTIWVESELGKGATFHFSLPADLKA